MPRSRCSLRSTLRCSEACPVLSSIPVAGISPCFHRRRITMLSVTTLMAFTSSVPDFSSVNTFPSAFQLQQGVSSSTLGVVPPQTAHVSILFPHVFLKRFFSPVRLRWCHARNPTRCLFGRFLALIPLMPTLALMSAVIADQAQNTAGGLV